MFFFSNLNVDATIIASFGDLFLAGYTLTREYLSDVPDFKCF